MATAKEAKTPDEREAELETLLWEISRLRALLGHIRPMLIPPYDLKNLLPLIDKALTSPIGQSYQGKKKFEKEEHGSELSDT